MEFEFATAGRVVVGVGRADDLGTVVVGLGSRAIVLTGSHPTRHAGLLSNLNLPYTLSTVDFEPAVEAAGAAVAAARDHGADVVVAIGGGSVLDLGKAVAVLLTNGGDPLDYLEVIGRGKPLTRPGLPCVAVPTTAGTGSEVTANAVLTSPEHGVKVSLRGPLVLPRLALVDPLLTVDCPPSVTASSGLDALTQCLEPFVSPRANPLTDCLAREGMLRAGRGLLRAYADGSDLEARTHMAVCSLFGGLALANATLGAVHGFASAIGGAARVPHGMACAALLVPVVEANLRALRSRDPDNPAIGRYAEAARMITGDPNASTADGVDWLRMMVERLRVPRLGEYGVGPTMADDIVAKAATANSTQGNPIALTTDELQAVFAAAI
ncbi:MAG TPA: iron-containing alcohol dehydrogenase [Micromonosporaceae bacterium]|jgi:alcohol dehydrogenase class IV